MLHDIELLVARLLVTLLQERNQVGIQHILGLKHLRLAFFCRLDGVLEIKDAAIRLGMQDIIVTTLTAMLEWRKHNNKVQIILHCQSIQ